VPPGEHADDAAVVAERLRRADADLAVAVEALDQVADSSPVDTPFVTSSRAPVVRFGPTDAPRLAVVIVAYGHAGVLVEALGRLAAETERLPGDVEIVVISQPHPDRGDAVAALLDRLTTGLTLVRSSSNLGFAGGNNLGVAVTTAPTLCLLNPDVLLEAGQLEALLAESDAHPDAIVAPRLVNLDGSTQERGWRVIHDGHTRPVLEHDTVQPDYASAACWLLRRPVFDAVGGFDTGYHPAYYEDVDFALAAAAMGHPTRIVEDVPVTHEWSVTVRGGPPDVAEQRARFVSKWSELIASRSAE